MRTFSSSLLAMLRTLFKSLILKPERQLKMLIASDVMPG